MSTEEQKPSALGKYAYVKTSSEEFAEEKQKEITSENTETPSEEPAK